MIRKVTLSLLAMATLDLAVIIVCAEPPVFGQRPGKPITPIRAEKRLVSTLPHTVVLGYEDFGPQVMAYELVGFGWNQWKSEGHELPDDVEVKVVVYKGVRLKKVKAAYPVVRGRSDYRYVEYGRALRFINGKTGELENRKQEEPGADSVKMWDDLITKLKSTKATIVRSLTRAR